MTNNFIGNEGCLIIGECFKYNKSLVSLNLSGNNILDDGVVYIAQNLKSEFNTTLKKINFRDNSITSKGIKSKEKRRWNKYWIRWFNY